MKRKILSVIALLVMMVALTGTASAINVEWQKDGIKKDPLFIRNGQSITLDLFITALRPQDNNAKVNFTISYTECIPADNCNINDVVDLADPNKMTHALLQNFTVTFPPNSPPENRVFLQKDLLFVTLKAPLERAPGTQYSFDGFAGPFPAPQQNPAAGITIFIEGGNITGMKFNDSNGDGIKGATEPGLPGWTINLKNQTTGVIIATTTTDSNGNYNFTNLRGNFTVEEVLQSGWTQTFPASKTYNVTVDAQDVPNLDFGNFANASISGQKFNDLNNNGIKDAGEPGLANWTIVLTKPDGTTISTMTDANGNYMFSNLTAGNYTVGEVLQAGWTQTFPAAPGTYIVPISSGQSATGIDFGNFKLNLNISGMKFNDSDRNGIKGATELGLPDWRIILRNASTGAEIDTTQTNVNGNYTFTNLTSGTYTVEEVLQPNWTQTAPNPSYPAPPEAAVVNGTWEVTLTANDMNGLDFGNMRSPPPAQPTASCVKGPNPSGKNIPPANGGQRPDGFYKLLAMDSQDPNPQIFVKDTGSGTIFGPFANGTNIKYTQAPGAKPGQKTIGGPKSAVEWHITGTGDAAVYAVDTFGNKSPEVLCKVPPPPK